MENIERYIQKRNARKSLVTFFPLPLLLPHLLLLDTHLLLDFQFPIFFFVLSVFCSSSITVAMELALCS